MPGAYSMVRLTHQLIDEPYTCHVTDRAHLLTPLQTAWSYSMAQGHPAPTLKISTHLSLEIQTFGHAVSSSEEDLPAAGPSSSASSSLPSTPQPPPPTHVHGLVGTCSYELYGGLQLCGGMVPQQHAGQHPPCQIPVFSSSSSLRTVFFPLAHPLHLDVSKPTCLDISVFRTVCGANDVYYFWDVDEDLAKGAPMEHQESQYLCSMYDQEAQEEKNEEREVMLELQHEASQAEEGEGQVDEQEEDYLLAVPANCRRVGDV